MDSNKSVNCELLQTKKQVSNLPALLNFQPRLLVLKKE